MPNARIVVVGSTNMDIVAKARQVPRGGETVIGDRFWMVMGGKGANQAVAARRLGAQTTFVGRVGKDIFGDQLLDTLRSFDIQCDHVQVDDQTSSGVALIMVDEDAENSIIVVPGANMQIHPSDIDLVSETLHQADILLLQLEIPLESVERAIDIAHQGDTLCVLNPAPARPIPDRLLEKVHIFTPNQHEATFFSGLDSDTAEEAYAAGRALQDKGIEKVIITLGKQGAQVFDGDESYFIPGTRVEAVDTTGAGDAFMGGLGVALGEGLPLNKATRFASAVAALSVTKAGATSSMPTRVEVNAFLADLSE
jgi:ribokinase